MHTRENSHNTLFNYTCFTSFALWSSSDRLLTRFDTDLVLDFALSINCNMLDVFFVISSWFLSITVTSSSIGTVKVISFSVFPPRQVNCFWSSSANSIMTKL